MKITLTFSEREAQSIARQSSTFRTSLIKALASEHPITLEEEAETMVKDMIRKNGFQFIHLIKAVRELASKKNPSHTLYSLAGAKTFVERFR